MNGIGKVSNESMNRKRGRTTWSCDCYKLTYMKLNLNCPITTFNTLQFTYDTRR